MDLEGLYLKVKALMEKVDFNLLWQGFKPIKFALYTDKECFFNGAYIPKSDEFLANTSINYKVEWIAIWNVMEEMSPEILCSKMIHEMFHGFQFANKESRFPDEFDAILNYDIDDENLSLKYEENKLIVSLIEKYNEKDFNQLFKIGYTTQS